MSRVAAYPLPPGDTRKPYGQSRTYRGDVPKQVGLVVDDSGYTNLFEGSAALANPEYFRSNLVALPHHLRPGEGGSCRGSTIDGDPIELRLLERRPAAPDEPRARRRRGNSAAPGERSVSGPVRRRNPPALRSHRRARRRTARPRSHR